MKKLCLVFAILIVTGCSANYKLNINSNFVEEEASIKVPFDVIDANSLKKQATSRTAYDGNLYNFNEKKDSNNYLLNYSYKYGVGDYSKSTILQKCYEKSGIENTDDVFSISTSDRFNCIEMEDDFYLDEVNVVIETDLKVLDNNADEKNGNTYIWNIDYSNYMNKPIVFKAEKNIFDKAKSFVLDIRIISTLLILFIIGFSLYWFIKYLKRKHIKNNQI